MEMEGRLMQKVSQSKQSGVSMIETIIIFPIVLMIALWIIHIGLVYQARANLEYAALMGARVGALNNIELNEIRAEVARRLTPSQIGSVPVMASDIRITVLNPTSQMFRDCGVVPSNPAICGPDIANCEIPNFSLQYRSIAPVCDGVNIQDANILRISVSYDFNSRVPFMSVRLFASDDGNRQPEGAPITAVATVRMQSSPVRSSLNYGAFL